MDLPESLDPWLDIRENSNPNNLSYSNRSEGRTVWRAFFFAVGTMLVIVGVECLMIDSATIVTDKPQSYQVGNSWFQQGQAIQVGTRVIQPPDWIPWSLIASGTVVILYALTLPRRWGGKQE